MDYLIGNARNVWQMFTFDPDSKIACVRRPIVIAVHFVLSSKNDEKCAVCVVFPVVRKSSRWSTLRTKNFIERIKSSSCTSLVSTVFQIRKPYFPSNVASIVIYNIYIVWLVPPIRLVFILGNGTSHVPRTTKHTHNTHTIHTHTVIFASCSLCKRVTDFTPLRLKKN